MSLSIATIAHVVLSSLLAAFFLLLLPLAPALALVAILVANSAREVWKEKHPTSTGPLLGATSARAMVECDVVDPLE